MNASELRSLLETGRFSTKREADTQADIEALLRQHCPVERERPLSPRDRPDFMVGGVAIEVKVKGAQRRAIVRQLERYAAHEVVEEIILVTGVSMPPIGPLNGKPVHVVSLGRSWL